MTTTSANVSPPAQTSADYNAAMDKIRDEMAKDNKGSINALGEIMTHLLQRFPGIAGELLKDGKDLKGCWAAMEKYARDHKSGNFYAMPPDVAENIIVEYYGLRLPTRVWEAEFSRGVVEAAGEPSQSAAPTALPEGEPGEGSKGATATEPDPFDLDALLGGL